MSVTYPTAVGPGFVILDGPPGPTGEAFPIIRKLTEELVVGTQDHRNEAALQAVYVGGRPGDIFTSPSGLVYVLDVINGRPEFTQVGGLSGPPGPSGGIATPPNHSLADHGIPNPIEFIPGDYEELLAGPSTLLTSTAFPTGP